MTCPRSHKRHTAETGLKCRPPDSLLILFSLFQEVAQGNGTPDQSHIPTTDLSAARAKVSFQAEPDSHFSLLSQGPISDSQA